MIKHQTLSHSLGDKVLDTAFEDVGKIVDIDETSEFPYTVLFKTKAGEKYVLFYGEQDIAMYIAPVPKEELN